MRTTSRRCPECRRLGWLSLLRPGLVFCGTCAWWFVPRPWTLGDQAAQGDAVSARFAGLEVDE
jgi:hypothetical protein